MLIAKMDNANFVHQVAQMSQSIKVMITTEGPRPGIEPRTSSTQVKHANHYTNGHSSYLETSEPVELHFVYVSYI